MSGDFLLLTVQCKELTQALKDAEQYGKEADADKSKLLERIKSLDVKLQSHHAALVAARSALEALGYSAGSILFDRAHGDRALARINATLHQSGGEPQVMKEK